jgi:hypothetical protein
MLGANILSPDEAKERIRMLLADGLGENENLAEKESHDLLLGLLGAYQTVSAKQGDSFWLRVHDSERRRVPGDPDIQLASQLSYNWELIPAIEQKDVLRRVYDVFLAVNTYPPMGQKSTGVYGLQEYAVTDLVLEPMDENVDIIKPVARMHIDSAMWMLQHLFMSGFMPPVIKEIIEALRHENQVLRETNAQLQAVLAERGSGKK